MASIRSEETKPEIHIKDILRKKDFKFINHDPTLPGNPDFSLKQYGAVIFVNGCFWHKHNCHIYNPSRILNENWALKVNKNKERDEIVLDELHKEGWKTLVIWECAIQGKESLGEQELERTVESWLLYDKHNAEVLGRARK